LRFEIYVRWGDVRFVQGEGLTIVTDTAAC
jgi:hypothetical protein